MWAGQTYVVQQTIRKLGSLVAKKHALAALELVLLGHAIPGCRSLLLTSGQRQLAKQRNGLPVPVQHQDVVLVHDWIIAAPDCLDAST